MYFLPPKKRHKHRFPPGKLQQSRHVGVSWHKERKKWVAQKWLKGKKVYLGYYASEEDAVRAIQAYVERAAS